MTNLLEKVLSRGNSRKYNELVFSGESYIEKMKILFIDRISERRKLKMKIGIIGAFGFDTLDTGGQPVKTRALYHGLTERYGRQNIEFVETMGWKKKPLKVLKHFFEVANKCDCLIMLPAENGLGVFVTLLMLYKNNRKIYYDVIGGWLPTFIERKKRICKLLQQFNGIWVETAQMQKDLEALGLNNVTIIPNFKDLNILKENEMNYNYEYPLPVCTFSRINKGKGIEDAINAVTAINQKYGKIIYKLDIYGAIGEEYVDEFKKMRSNFPEYISYKGIVPADKSVETVKQYFLLLFPTRFYTEGIPGTLIDAYCAGVPVISALWLNYVGVFENEVTGYGYPFGDVEQFEKQLEYAAVNIEKINMLKKNCLCKAHLFSKDIVINNICNYLEA